MKDDRPRSVDSIVGFGTTLHALIRLNPLTLLRGIENVELLEAGERVDDAVSWEIVDKLRSPVHYHTAWYGHCAIVKSTARLLASDEETTLKKSYVRPELRMRDLPYVNIKGAATVLLNDRLADRISPKVRLRVDDMIYRVAGVVVRLSADLREVCFDSMESENAKKTYLYT